MFSDYCNKMDEIYENNKSFSKVYDQSMQFSYDLLRSLRRDSPIIPIIINSSISVVVGFIYSKVFKTDPRLTMLAWLADAVAFNILVRLSQLVFRADTKENEIKSLNLQLFVCIATKTISIMAFRHLGLIGMKGTVTFGLWMLFDSYKTYQIAFQNIENAQKKS